MANKYDKHITGDKWKWAVAFILIFVLLAGMVFVILQSFTPYKPLEWFKKKDDVQTADEGRDIPQVTDGEGNNVKGQYPEAGVTVDKRNVVLLMTYKLRLKTSADIA